MRDLDFRGQLGSQLREQGAAIFAIKAEAATFARRCGWFQQDVIRAANRFCIFWVVGQDGGPGMIRLLAKDCSVIEAPHPGYW